MIESHSKFQTTLRAVIERSGLSLPVFAAGTGISETSIGAFLVDEGREDSRKPPNAVRRYVRLLDTFPELLGQLVIWNEAETGKPVICRQAQGRPRGARFPGSESSAFTEEQVAEIRRRRNEGEGNNAIARAFGVNPSRISRICNR